MEEAGVYTIQRYLVHALMVRLAHTNSAEDEHAMADARQETKGKQKLTWQEEESQRHVYNCRRWVGCIRVKVSKRLSRRQEKNGHDVIPTMNSFVRVSMKRVCICMRR